MLYRFLVLAFVVTTSVQGADLAESPHDYWKRPLSDRFTQRKAELESGRLPLDVSSEKAFVLSLLKVLEVPASSQMLVFSTTSLQLSLISPSNPRALYFSDELYVAYVPNGRIEVVSIDPDLGGIYYLLDIPRDAQALRIERSTKCMNCHAHENTEGVPGLVLKSVVPGPTGGSLTAYRIGQTGHGVPFNERFGGWYVTGKHAITGHWGNMTGQLSSAGLKKIPLEPGQSFDFAHYPAPTSDILAHLLHEHQVGFVNRTVSATYRAREILSESHNQPDVAQAAELDKLAKTLTRYLLFADEAPLPIGGVEGDAGFKADFLLTRHAAKNGASLKDLDLRTRFFRNRCSYMIYSAAFTGLPAPLKQRIYRDLGSALKPANSDFRNLLPAEKATIHGILQDTLPDLPGDW